MRFALRMLRNTVKTDTKSMVLWTMADLFLAPILKDVDISYTVIRFNGSLLKENVFRQGAGPEVDAAWASLGVDCKIVVGCRT